MVLLYGDRVRESPPTTTNHTMAATTRSYPMSCRSMFCGEVSCPATCPHLAELQEFKAWKKANNAVQSDPIWSPSIYTAA